VTEKIRLLWEGRGMEFDAGREAGPRMKIDGDGKVAPSPMTTFLVAIAACTASDIVDIAGKMRVSIGSFTVDTEGDRREQPPRYYTHIRIVYRLGGVAEADRDKIQRAVQLSHDTYCSALHSIRADIEVRSEVVFA
jgi:putative redox protein